MLLNNQNNLIELSDGDTTEIYEITNADKKGRCIVRCFFKDSCDFGINEWEMTADSAEGLLDYINRANGGGDYDTCEMDELLLNEDKRRVWKKNYVTIDAVVKAIIEDAEICSFVERAGVYDEWVEEFLLSEMVEEIENRAYDISDLPEWKRNVLLEKDLDRYNYADYFEKNAEGKSIKELCKMYLAYMNFEFLQDEERVFVVRVQRDVRIKATSEKNALSRASELCRTHKVALNVENSCFSCVGSDCNFNDCNY